MARKRLCKSCSGNTATGNEPIWAMQPFGPDEEVTFAALGSHYRGFPVVEVCDSCKQGYQAGKQTLLFTYRDTVYSLNTKQGLR